MRLQQQIHANAMKEKKFSGRPPSWKKTFDASQQPIALSLHKQHIPNILYFIHTRDMDTLYQVFIQYFSTIGKMKSRIYLLKKHWDSLQEYDMEHLKPSILLALYASMQLDAESVRTRRIIFGHDVRHTEYIGGIMKT